MLSNEAVMVAKALKELIDNEYLVFDIKEEKDKLDRIEIKNLEIYISGELVTSITLDVKEI